MDTNALRFSFFLFPITFLLLHIVNRLELDVKYQYYHIILTQSPNYRKEIDLSSFSPSFRAFLSVSPTDPSLLTLNVD
jgi:hypothetical protein